MAKLYSEENYLKTRGKQGNQGKKWSGRWDLNPRPSDSWAEELHLREITYFLFKGKMG